jgi:hypothetical protein
MIIFTSHVKPQRLPLLVREGFSWGAAIFGWLWLLVQGAWVPALLLLAGALAAGKLMALTHSVAPLIAIVLIQGVFGHDLLRWWFSLRGYRQDAPVAALTHDAALLRLLNERPDLQAGLGGSRL